IASGSLAAEVPATKSRGLGTDIGFSSAQRGVLRDLYQRPVVQPSTSHGVFIDAKPELPHQVQRAASCRTQTRDVAGIRGYLGLDQHDMQAPSHGSSAQASRWPIVGGHCCCQRACHDSGAVGTGSSAACYEARAWTATYIRGWKAKLRPTGFCSASPLA